MLCVTGIHTLTICSWPSHTACSEGWQVLEDTQKLFLRAAINWLDCGLNTTSFTSQAVLTHIWHLLVSSLYISWWRCTFHLIYLAVQFIPSSYQLFYQNALFFFSFIGFLSPYLFSLLSAFWWLFTCVFLLNLQGSYSYSNYWITFSYRVSTAISYQILSFQFL